jgi:HKD family nuclease
MQISSNLYSVLSRHLRKADEVWIAVALVNKQGIMTILEATRKDCSVNIIVGIDLPTDPLALREILTRSLKRNIKAYVFTSGFYHPKVYAIRYSDKYITAIGSANLTGGGLEKNLEMTAYDASSKTFNDIIKWYNKDLLPGAIPLSDEFIKKYTKLYDARIKQQKRPKKEIEQIKRTAEESYNVSLTNRKAFVSALKSQRKNKDYQQWVKNRNKVVTNLRKHIDYPEFNNIDLESFLAVKELGTIIPIKLKGQINANPKRFQRTLKHLCDESLPIEKRIDDCLNGKDKIPEVSISLLSKVLVLHKPKIYYLHNGAVTDALEPFGLYFPRGLSFGNKYKLMNELLLNIRTQTEIDDFATLDVCIWYLNHPDS